jgi:hypothetical protein
MCSASRCASSRCAAPDRELIPDSSYSADARDPRLVQAVTLLAQSLNLPIRVCFKKPFQPLALSLPSAAGPDDDLLAFEFLIMTRDVPASAAAAANGGGGGRRSDAGAAAAAAAPKVERSASKAARSSGIEPDGPRATSSAGRLTQGARRLRLGPSIEPSGSETSPGGGGRSSLHGGGRAHGQRDVSEVALPPVGHDGQSDDDDDRAGGIDYRPPSSADPHRQVDRPPANPADGGDLTFSHPLAHSTARPRPAAEPLFYPAPASQLPLSQQARPFASQLTQAELEDLGLGGLDGLDFDMADDDNDDGDGFDFGVGKRSPPPKALDESLVPTQTDAEALGTQIAQTQVERVGRAFVRCLPFADSSDAAPVLD